MRPVKKNIITVIVSFFLLLLYLPGLAQYGYYDIRPLNNQYAFAHTHTPDNLVPLFATATANSYTWKSSLIADPGSLTAISNSNTPSYSFSGPLPQTTYFQRIAHLPNNVNIESNIIEVEVVSVKWENLNYVREHEVLIPGQTDWKAIDQLPIGQKLQTTTYMDGIGRMVEKVSRETATPSASAPNTWGDVVQFSKYDALGREEKGYLPYTTSTEPGSFKTAPLTEQPQYYSSLYSETYAFSTPTFDNSPLNRITNVKSPGTAWSQNQGKNIQYELNDANDNVQIFTIGFNSGDIPVRLGVYPEKTLYKTISADEAGRRVIEYSDFSGQLILKKVEVGDNPSAAHEGWICTYSVFDDFGLLRYRLQPEAVKWLDAHSWAFTGTDGLQVLNEWCFRYEYDEKGRNILKKAPGAKELKMLYDQRDRVVFMQDGNQRLLSPAEWTTNLYDDLDRPTITTLYHTSKSVSALQSDINNAVTYSTVNVDNPGGALNDLVVDQRKPEINPNSYTARNSIEFIAGFESADNDDFVAEINPNANGQTITVTTALYKNPISDADLNNTAVNTVIKYSFYDDYSYSNAKSFHTAFDNGLAYSTGEPIVTTKRTLGMITGGMVRILGSSTFLTTTIFYDDEGRPIQTIEDNIKSGTDITTLQYQFDGRLLSTNSKHTAAGSSYSHFSTVTKNVYDKIGRVTSIEKKYGSNAFKTIAGYDMDDMGRLKTKHLDPGYTDAGKNELESLQYSYDIQNQITGINKDYALKTPGLYSKWGNFFGLYLGFDDPENVFSQKLLTGQVGGLLWTTQGDDAQRKYDFTYDKAGRLINALFAEKETPGDSWSNGKMNFSVTGNSGKISYDLNGNLLNMLQKGVLPGTNTPVTVDDLQYSYANLSNKLMRVTDNGNLGDLNGKLGDFKDGSNSGTDDYVYDDNGNLVIDLNKNAKDLGAPVNSNYGIKYNFLDKPEEIRISGKGIIRIVYDADGNKMQKIFTPEGGGNTVTTTYINEYVYKGEELQYINFEEGRIRVMQAVSENNGYDILTMDGNMDLPGNKRGAWDYFIRDYQGNVRMILTEETHLGSNSCTLETARAANEEPLFGKVDASGVPTPDNEVKARFPVSDIPGQSSGNGWENNTIGNYVSRLGNLAGKKVGPNTILKVMAGDEISATTIYYYQNPVTNSSGANTLLTEILTSLAGAITGSGATSALAKDAAGNITGLLNSSVPFSSLTAPDAANAGGNNPKAYLTVLFFDERFNLVNEGSTSLRVSQSGNNAPALVLSNIKAPKNGYAYVYVSNTSDEMVYFDNLQVANNHKQIIEENHYYAYGLKIAGISSRKLPDLNEGHIDNKNFYNDKELIDEADLDWYDYGFRNYDAQIGRFTQLDPLTDDYPYYTPYQFAGCEPIANVDVDGLEPSKAVVDFAGQVGGEIGKSGANWVVRYGIATGTAARIFKTAAPSVASSITKTGVLFGLGVLKGIGGSIVNIVKTAALLSNPMMNPIETANLINGLKNTAQAAIAANAMDPLNGLAQLYVMDKVDRFAKGGAEERGVVTGEILFDVGTFLIPGGEAGAISSVGTKALRVSELAVAAEKTAAAAAKTGQTVFRAVDATEAGIIKSTGKFSLQQGGVEAKYFAQSLEDAHWYGQKLYPNGYSIIKGTVRAPVNAAEHWFPYVDIGAYVFPKETLPYIIPH